ncbi:MAG: M20 family metallopeptidase [Deltaproteobacteria bacterium]|nr:M20 family metallopeptidase [Deltaproteobacteria bacterium]
MDPVKAQISSEVDALAQDMFAISDFLKANPETAYQEYKACDHLSRVLEDKGFRVQKGVGNVATSFLAQPADGKPDRPCVAFLAEYDALPKIGHGCGHNFIAAASLGAAIALNKILKIESGGLVVVGTPAEEGGGGKVRLAEAGVFDEIDLAMMFHPGGLNIAGKDMLGRIKFRVEFFGRTAHASGSPDRGINALDAMVTAYSSINAIRQHLRPDGRIHGIITHGGDAPNIIPDYAAGLFYVRAGSRSYRDEIFERVTYCAKGAAMAIGTECKIEIDPPKLDPMKRNAVLEAAIEANMEALDISPDADDGRRGSSDIANLSHYLPSMHPVLAIVEPEIPGHSIEFREATTSDRGRKTLLKAAKMLAMTAYDFLSSAEMRKQVAEEFNRYRD